MPGPIIRDTTPEWLKPQNASVLDSPLVKAVRALATITGMNDPQQAVFSAMAPTPMIGLVPRLPVANIVENFTGVEKPAALNAAIRHMAERFPRVMSHIRNLKAAPLNDADRLARWAEHGESVVKGTMQPVGLSELADQPGAISEKFGRRIAEVTVDPDRRVAQFEPDFVKTLAHEATHVGQNLRQTDRALRDQQQDIFSNVYARVKAQTGYAAHPMEQRAFAVGDKKAQDYGAINVARKMLMGGSTDQEITERLQQVIIGATEKSIQKSIRIAKTMAARAAEAKK